MGHFQCQIGMQKGCTEIKPAAVGRADGKGVGMDFQAVRLGIGCRRCFPDVRGGFLKRLRPGRPVADAQGRELLSVTGRLRFSCLPDGDKGKNAFGLGNGKRDGFAEYTACNPAGGKPQRSAFKHKGLSKCTRLNDGFRERRPGKDTDRVGPGNPAETENTSGKKAFRNANQAQVQIAVLPSSTQVGQG